MTARPAATRSGPAAPALEITGLTVRHPGTPPAVDGVSLRLAAGAALTLVGESGSGKTTLARAVLALPAPGTTTTGSVRVDGTDLSGLGARELSRIRGRRIGYVPQDPTTSLDPLRRIGSQITEVLLRHRAAPGRRAARAAVPAVLARAGLTDPHRIARSRPHELSGGQRQRAAIALAVCCGPRLLVADEPTTALDPLLRVRILDLFTALRTETGLALLLITHDLAAARRIGGTVAVLRAGRIAETGPAADVLHRPSHPYTADLARLPAVAADPGARP
ncbi:ABC transporter ATP-binding protein [Streptomyces yaizuensis]|uniref:ABC transporter ATP-binding protein n=1 Tax=Streptomyces yaizuensis TaxID=2989713 RepID=A0ABQ5NRS6_9ACTN|nr:ABC transporter ATP-binding protein [Streptomyces sp. YSPA8]GLF93045.1 ABC transporter ATP-binding protein [Streptomyces sp. YSPA8]